MIMMLAASNRGRDQASDAHAARSVWPATIATVHLMLMMLMTLITLMVLAACGQQPEGTST